MDDFIVNLVNFCRYLYKVVVWVFFYFNVFILILCELVLLIQVFRNKLNILEDLI